MSAAPEILQPAARRHPARARANPLRWRGLVGVLALLPFLSVCAWGEDGNENKGELWRSVSRVRGRVSIEDRVGRNDQDGSNHFTVDETTQVQVDFMMERERPREEELPAELPPQLAKLVREQKANAPKDESSSLDLSWHAVSAKITGVTMETIDHAWPNHQARSTTHAEFSGPPRDLKEFHLDLNIETGAWQLVSPGKLREKYRIVNAGTELDTVWNESREINEVSEIDDVVNAVFDGKLSGKPVLVKGISKVEQGGTRDNLTGWSSKIGRLEFWPEFADAEVEIKIEGYAKWRPEGSIQQPAKPGNKLVARATLMPKAGGRVEDLPKVKKFRFELLDTSSEPGVCLNWPLGAKDTDYDLRLAATPQFVGQLADKEQTNAVSQTKNDDQGRPYAETQIDSYDFGGRATLQVIGELGDGREIVGRLKDEDGPQELVRLPKMKVPGWIADSWRKENKAEQLADNDDNEKVDGQKDNGDGFTLYEEYRGWVEKGKHIEGDPLKKDFFVLNLIEADARGGITLFTRLSKLRVHSHLRDGTEMSQETRLMNGNHRDAPHRVDQHGVAISHAAGGAGGYNVGVEGADKSKAGRPRNVEFVYVETHHADGAFAAKSSAENNLSERDAQFAYDRAVAHELFHAVGVDHHGERLWHYVKCYFQGASAPLNPTHRTRFTTDFGLPPFQIEKKLDWNENRGDTITLLWEDTRRDVAEDSIAEYDAELAKRRADYRTDSWVKETEDTAARISALGIKHDSFFWMEYGADHFAADNLSRVIRVGELGGTDCGNELCVMRYYFAEAYEIAGKKNAYYLIRPQPGAKHAGREICTSPAGTGANASSHQPQSRFGDAAAGRGNCFGDICPNDAIPPRSIVIK